jgi:hypothetical protein
MTCNEVFPLPLYHGTSTLFLEGILNLGLGGKDPLSDLGLPQFIIEIQPLIEANLLNTDTYQARAGSWEQMRMQRVGAWNFQHGQTYLSPSKDTAIRYASNKRYGSELLTYTLDFLQMLVDREIPVISTLYQRYPRIFDLLSLSPAPLLIRVDDVPTISLLDERGNQPALAIAQVKKLMDKYPDQTDTLLQQLNFRLIDTIPKDLLRIWMINVIKHNMLAPECSLYEISKSDTLAVA